MAPSMPLGLRPSSRFRRHYGDVAQNLKVRHDHGTQHRWEDFQRELPFLGIEGSHAFVMEPEGKGCAEGSIWVFKEELLWVRSFGAIEELGRALVEFKDTYNNTWIIERHWYKRALDVGKEQIRSLSRVA